MALTKSPAIVQRSATVGLMERLTAVLDSHEVTKTELISRSGINRDTISKLIDGSYDRVCPEMKW